MLKLVPLNAYSVQKNLKPAYIFSGKAPWPLIGVDAPDGDIYQAEGYRLPTVAEFDYVLTQGGKFAISFFPSEDELEYFRKLSQLEDGFEVGEVFPMKFQNAIFFDLHGGTQWTNDSVLDTSWDQEVSHYKGVKTIFHNFFNRCRVPGFEFQHVTNPEETNTSPNFKVSNSRRLRGELLPTTCVIKLGNMITASVYEVNDWRYKHGIRLARTLPRQGK